MTWEYSKRLGSETFHTHRIVREGGVIIGIFAHPSTYYFFPIWERAEGGKFFMFLLCP